jgi:putative sigma-54 modulation protein
VWATRRSSATEVFVFRDHAGQVRVLHRKKDGKMELIEVP